MSLAPAPTLELDQVERSFTSGNLRIRVLKGVSLTIQPGEMTLIVGPSGSGKSTLLAILSGLLRPDQGQATALGIHLGKLADAELDRFRLEHCGFVFQGFNLFAALSAIEQVIYPLQFLPGDSRERRARAEAALAIVGLTDKADRHPIELSGGEKQRVAIARAIAKAPKLLFADEPTSALDKENGSNVARFLHDYARERGATVLCVSHDQRLIDHADRVIRIEDGTITSDERKHARKEPLEKETA